MYNTTHYGVQRAHSFDSYDDLEKWRAVREHRMQFLSTRAKFDKLPPSQPPPPPPPRKSSRFKIIPPPSLSSSASPRNQLIQNFNEELRNRGAYDKENQNYTSVFQKKNKEYRQNQPINQYTTTPTELSTEHTNSFTINTLQTDTDDIKFRTLESPGSVLKLTQSWQQVKMGPAGEIHNIKEPYQEVPSQIVAEERKQHVEIICEAPVVQKKVNVLGYVEPTCFQDININTTTSQSSKHSEVHVPFELPLHSKSEQKTFQLSSEVELSLLKENTQTSQIVDTRKEQNPLYLQNSMNKSKAMNDLYQRESFQELHGKSKYNIQEDRRKYLESSLMFTGSLPEQERIDNCDNLSVSTNELYPMRPRRISTGSMHEPTNWHSQYPTTRVKGLVQKFSNAEMRSNYK